MYMTNGRNRKRLRQKKIKEAANEDLHIKNTERFVNYGEET